MATCAECGFLGRAAQRGNGDPDWNVDLVEVDGYQRDEKTDWVRVWERCFKSRAEIGGKGSLPPRAVFRFHDCSEFSQYKPSFSPRGLQDYLMLQEIREQEERRFKAQRDWQLERDREQLDWQRDETNIQRKWEKNIDDRNRRDRWILGVLTLLAIAASAVVSSLAAVGVIGG